ncbi:uncharacterized protein LTR77_000045 [Saxophila tyrrhenica]|uniref:LYR motif-containing protein Cup1-like N-terminal domain-containing protein n=1 Tax=Saxophila tyrrhenica TaxID=1690608 RepID=A0AAV9PPD2_9PEZI|nr:hypothetical protein LTR77_000045 [Saxophila tyrrhenica]
MLRWRHILSQPGSRTLYNAAPSHGVTINEALIQPKPTPTPKKASELANRRPSGLRTKILEEVQRGLCSRHLLRAILRECTYLPDKWARQWTAQRAISRFRSYEFKAWEHRKDESYGERLMKKEKEARSSLALLRRANEGERKCLLRVLFMAYGRVGKRRHELIEPLLRQNTPFISIETEAEDGEQLDRQDELTAEWQGNGLGEPPHEQQDERQHDIADKGKQSRTLDLTPQFTALVMSQMKNAPPKLVRPNPRHIQPVIPERNTWLRPMPQKRIKNMKQKHYAYLLDRIQPPLPSEQWLRLRGLALGSIHAEPVPARRGNARASPGLDEGNSALEMVVQRPKVPLTVFGSKDGHALMQRFLRRVYTEVFSQCPMMELKEGSSDEWEITWGGEKTLAQYQARLHGKGHTTDA